MTARPVSGPPPRPTGKLAILQAENIPVAFFRYLYHEVGDAWHWVERKRMSDEDIRGLLSSDDVQIYVLYVDGVPAGYTEIDWSQMPVADLRYFGLTADFMGRRLGPFFLDQVLDMIWARGPDRITVETCTLDHPKALALYQRFGFTPYAQARETIELPDDTPD